MQQKNGRRGLPPSGPVRIAILDDYHDIARGCADWSVLPGRCEVEVIRRNLSIPEEAAEVLAPFHMLVPLRERMAIPAALLDRLPNLCHIAMTGQRGASIDAAAAEARGISVSGTRSGGPPRGPGGVVELTWALILAGHRKLALEDRSMRQGVWQAGGLTRSLGGQCLGILGLGRLGRKVAAIAPAFGMDVIAWSPRLTEAAAREHGAERVTREALFARADVLSIHIPLTPASRGSVGAAELAAMKPGALLVNTSRGPIVDEAALVAALRSGRIAAALDVYDIEPLPSAHPLLALDNATLAPHLGYYTAEAIEGFYAGAVENIAAFLSGRPTLPFSDDGPATGPQTETPAR